MKDKIEFSEFLELEKKLEIKIGKVISVEDVPKSNKLLKLNVEFGEEVRIVVTNIKPDLDNPDIAEKPCTITRMTPSLKLISLLFTVSKLNFF